ncbi:hypothetical protein ACQP1G_29210 [Nocardia sp. CA-107356]|uniref:hypothetical protein n=1 Tax=Nocardia sp. CA-107356 TaxID=3239972 RepID=UPI003D8D0FB0
MMKKRVGIAALAAASGAMPACGVAGAQSPDVSNGFRAPSGNMTCVVADKGVTPLADPVMPCRHAATER